MSTQEILLILLAVSVAGNIAQYAVWRRRVIEEAPPELQEKVKEAFSQLEELKEKEKAKVETQRPEPPPPPEPQPAVADAFSSEEKAEARRKKAAALVVTNFLMANKDEVRKRIETVVRRMERVGKRTGEQKKDYVRHKLLLRFPDLKDQDTDAMIEEVVRRVKKKKVG